MSVYITIQSADLKKKPKQDLFVTIQSQQAVLKTQDTYPSENPRWNSSIVGSIRERSLIFQIRQNGQVNDAIIGTGRLRFNTFEFNPFKQIPYHLKMKNKSNKEVGTLYLNIYYNEKKNYVGEIEFYELGNAQTMSNIKYVYDIDQINKGLVPKQRVIFYKGPCHTKNAFSCCDQDTQSQKFQVLEPHYRDDYY